MHDDLIAELSHQINSPLAAIRNAIYLAASRTADLEVRRYLELADSEVVIIASALRNARSFHPAARKAQGSADMQAQAASTKAKRVAAA
ncbi:MAG TPA: histidine kinase dimerization/phospho-acceptor domain-containing protein [Clostridia bacterium]|nr:histidine kinase dimerization/phospho-acceptor domain-containing protein [Clostridia bacterium]